MHGGKEREQADLLDQKTDPHLIRMKESLS